MLAYKFLGAGALGTYSGFSWPVGEWIEVGAPLVPSRRGIHACRVGDLPHWLDDELWRVELKGDVLEEERMLVASRGRLLERLEGWNAGVFEELADACVERSRPYPGWREDAAEWAAYPDRISAVYIVAHAAGLASEAAGERYASGFDAERAWQAAWIAERVGV
ncbi:MAG: hypothetical protein ACRDON_00255 [Gaiellaceae bacterium]